MSVDEAQVHIVDDDEAVRDSLRLLFKSVGLPSALYTGPEDFLNSYDDNPGCLVLDVRMPYMNGLQLMREIRQRGWMTPVIFITGHGDIPMAVEAIHEGAMNFLQKPFREADLLNQVQEALAQDAEQRGQLNSRRKTNARLGSLTPREREIADCIVLGQANKVIAIELGISLRTVELHRARIMEKMQARSVAELVRMMLGE